MFQKILAPVDLSEPDIASAAFEIAGEMARASGGSVRLLHVINGAVTIAPMLYLPPVDFNQLGETQKKALAELTKGIDLPADRITTNVRIGGVYPEVLAEALEWNADLVIVGAHRPSMATYLLGSSSTAIVRHATCSVLVVRSSKAASFFA